MKPTILLTALIATWLIQGPALAANQSNDAHSHAELKVQPKKSAKEPPHAHEEDEQHDEHSESGGHDEHDEHGHEETLSTKVSDSIANDVAILTARADSQLLTQREVVYGKLSVDPDSISHVNARFTGLIKSVRFSIGDRVKAGDMLAEIESNESLNSYSIKAPINGVVIQRQANKGEVSQQQALFTLANFDTLWADFRIYPSQRSLIATGQNAEISAGETRVTGTVRHILSSLNQPYSLARVKLDNSMAQLSAGQLIEGYIVTGEFQVALAVKKAAIHIMDNQTGVFVKNNEDYTFTPLRLGRSDNTYTEVIAGLQPGQLYVTDNSYLLKADIEKSAAEHAH